MRFRWLAAFPLLYAAAFVAVTLSLLGGEALGPFVTWQRILARVLALAGCLAAMSVFERGDHLRRAWLFLSVGTLLILSRDLLRLLPVFAPDTAGPEGQLVISALAILSNLSQLAGVWMLAHSWRRAAIALPGGRTGALTVGIVAALLAVAVAGPAALTHARAVAAGDSTALVLVVSAVVDILSLCLVAPLLLTAISLRQGLFVWPWALIVASRLSWLLYDAAEAFGTGLVPAGFPLPDIFRGLALNYLFAAGLAQFFVIRQIRRR